MASINDLFPSKYLAKSDFPSPRVVTIERLGKAEMNENGGKVMNNIVYFVGIAKPMVLKRINATSIAEIHGDDPAVWPGKVIEVFTDPGVMMGAKRVGGLRVRAPSTTQQFQPAPVTGSVAMPSPSANGQLWDYSYPADNGQKAAKGKQTAAAVIDFLDEFTDSGGDPATVRVRPSGSTAPPVTGNVWRMSMVSGAETEDATFPF